MIVERNVLRVHTLGRLHVRNAGGVVAGAAAQPRRLVLLALLAAAGESGLTREKVLALWADTEEDRGRRALSQAVYALRQDLGTDELFLGGREDLRLNPEMVTSDVGEFESALSSSPSICSSSQSRAFPMEA